MILWLNIWCGTKEAVLNAGLWFWDREGNGTLKTRQRCVIAHFQVLMTAAILSSLFPSWLLSPWWQTGEGSWNESAFKHAHQIRIFDYLVNPWMWMSNPLGAVEHECKLIQIVFIHIQIGLIQPSLIRLENWTVIYFLFLIFRDSVLRKTWDMISSRQQGTKEDGKRNLAYSKLYPMDHQSQIALGQMAFVVQIIWRAPAWQRLVYSAARYFTASEVVEAILTCSGFWV